MGQVGYSGNETSLGKTSPEDFRRFLDALYTNAGSNPVIKGGRVSGRADRSYAYAAGVGVLQVGAGAVVLTWGSGTTSLVTQPSVARTDVIYVDSEGAVRVAAEGAVNESSVIVIDKMVLPAGATATSQATRKVNRNFALPYGTSMGWLGQPWIHIFGGPVSKSTSWSTLTSVNFSTSTDRIVDIVIHQSIHGLVDYGLADSDARKLAVGAMAYRVFLDNVHLRSFEIAFNRFRAVSNHTIHYVHVSEGAHTVRVERRWTGVGADPIYFGGGPDLEEGNFVGVKDVAVAE